jgi:hypothetical protein
VQQYINDLVLKPPGFTFIAKHFTRAGQRYQLALRRLNARIADVVASNRRKASKDESHLEEATDLLSMFMARKDPDGKEFTNKFLRDVGACGCVRARVVPEGRGGRARGVLAVCPWCGVFCGASVSRCG